MTDENNFDLFITYIQIKGNEAVNDKNKSGSTVIYDAFLSLTERIISISAKQEKFSKLNDIIFKKVLIQGSYSVIRKALKDKTKKIDSLFASEKDATKGLNLFLIPEIIKYLLTELPQKIYENEDDFMNLLTILILIPLTFRDDKNFAKNVYMSIYKLISPLVNNGDKFSLSFKSKVLSFKLLKETFDKVNFNLSITDYNCFTNEQKILFEIYLLIRQLDEQTPDFNSIFTYPDKVLDVERCKIVLKEMKKFDMVSYLTYFNKELTDEEKTTKIYEETLHNRYSGKVSAKFSYTGFKKMGIKLSEDSKLEGTTSIAFTSDPEGRNVIKCLSQLDIDASKTDVNMNSTMFYVHYPYNSHKILCWGYGSDYRLGNNNTSTTTNPIEMQDFTKKIKKL